MRIAPNTVWTMSRPTTGRISRAKRVTSWSMTLEPDEVDMVGDVDARLQAGGG
jgi:hypothetical protein